MLKERCNYYDKDGRCEGKATRVILFGINDKFSVRTKICKKHFEELNFVQFEGLPFYSKEELNKPPLSL